MNNPYVYVGCRRLNYQGDDFSFFSLVKFFQLLELTAQGYSDGDRFTCRANLPLMSGNSTCQENTSGRMVIQDVSFANEYPC